MITTFLPTWKNSYVTCEGRALCTSLHLNRILDKILWYTGMIIIRYTSLKKDTLLISNLFQISFHVFQMPLKEFYHVIISNAWWAGTISLKFHMQFSYQQNSNRVRFSRHESVGKWKHLPKFSSRLCSAWLPP